MGGWGCLRKLLSTPRLQKANKGQSRAIERLKKKMFENEFWLLLNSPAIPFRIHNRNGKVRGAGRGTGSALPARSLLHRPLSYRATSSCSPLTMRGPSGGRPFRNCRKKVSLGLLRPSRGSCPPSPRGHKEVLQDLSLLLAGPHGQRWLHPSEAPLLSSCRPPGLCPELSGAAGAHGILLQATHRPQHPGHQQ